MKRITLILAVLGALLAPAAAHAGDYKPTPKPSPQTPCPCCQDLSTRIDQLELVFNQKIQQLEARITNLEQTVTNLQNQITMVDQRVTNIINTPDPLRCESDRVYRFLIRTEINGSPVVDVTRGEVRGEAQYWSVDRVTRGGQQRFRVTADYRGVVAPVGQLRSVTSFVRTADGRRYRTVQKLRLCLERDGNLNDASSQNRAGI